MKIPTYEYCKNLFVKHNVPLNIRKHCEAVTRTGIMLATHLIWSGVNVDLRLVLAGCALHDAFKAASFEVLKPQEDGFIPTKEQINYWSNMYKKFGGQHEIPIAATMLREDGFDDFSKFVSKIGWTRNDCYYNEGIEIKIAHYADWRNKGDVIVPFEQRLDELFETYAKKDFEGRSTEFEKYKKERMKKEFALEDELFRHLSFASGDLKVIVNRSVVFFD